MLSWGNFILYNVSDLTLKIRTLSLIIIGTLKHVILYAFQIKASDQDCGANGTILYSLEKADTEIFEINSTSGKLCLKNNGQGNETHMKWVLT